MYSLLLSLLAHIHSAHIDDSCKHDALRQLDKHLLCSDHLVGSVESPGYIRSQVHTIRRGACSVCVYFCVQIVQPAPIYGAE